MQREPNQRRRRRQRLLMWATVPRTEKSRDLASQMMNPELVIFDCHGVLVDSEAIVIEIESELLIKAGFAMTVDDCVGLSWPDVMAMLEKNTLRPKRPTRTERRDTDQVA